MPRRSDGPHNQVLAELATLPSCVLDRHDAHLALPDIGTTLAAHGRSEDLSESQ